MKKWEFNQDNLIYQRCSCSSMINWKFLGYSSFRILVKVIHPKNLVLVNTREISIKWWIDSPVFRDKGQDFIGKLPKHIENLNIVQTFGLKKSISEKFLIQAILTYRTLRAQHTLLIIRSPQIRSPEINPKFISDPHIHIPKRLSPWTSKLLCLKLRERQWECGIEKVKLM